MDPALFATKAPRNNPIIIITIVDVANSNNVLGVLSIMISRTLDEPELVVKKLEFPRSNVATLNKVLKNRVGEYQGSFRPSDLY
jgi:hypothetical protein